MIFDSATRVLPREIVVEKSGNRVRYRFPRRRLGLIRLVGLVPIAFGVAFAAIPMTMMWTFFEKMFRDPQWIYLLFIL
ncbi:MAG TPA: hypothetical protein VK530_17230, partial [Candidatus Acidoferrum sp.]|nr:hypothetical protein [Candidatus Acidoferrum sp.]